MGPKPHQGTRQSVLARLAPIALIANVGCFNSANYLRSGETLRKGEYSMHLTWAVPIGAPGSLSSPGGQKLSGNLSRRVAATWAGAGVMAAFTPQITFETGLSDSVEIGAVLGMDGFGPNLRVPLSREAKGDPLSIASSFGVIYRPMAGTNLPLFRAGIDASARTSGGLAPLLDLYATYGPERYAVPLPSSLDDGPHEGPFLGSASAQRTELRLNGAIGFSYASGSQRNDSEGKLLPNVAIGVIPYFTPYARAPEFACSCRDKPTTLEQNWGIAAVVQIGGATRKAPPTR